MGLTRHKNKKKLKFDLKLDCIKLELNKIIISPKIGLNIQLPPATKLPNVGRSCRSPREQTDRGLRSRAGGRLCPRCAFLTTTFPSGMLPGHIMPMEGQMIKTKSFKPAVYKEHLIQNLKPPWLSVETE